MVEVPKVRSSNDVMDVPGVKQRRVSTTLQTARKKHQTVEVARITPQERIKPAGESASVRERVRQFEMNGAFHVRARWKRLESRPTAGKARILKTRHHTVGACRKVIQTRMPQCTSPSAMARATREQKSVDDSAELETRPRGESEGVPVAQLDDILSEVKDVKSELLQVRELVGVLVRRERCVEVKMEVAGRRLDRMEQEKDEADDAEREADHEPDQSREADCR